MDTFVNYLWELYIHKMHNNLSSSNYVHMPMHTNEQHTESHECNKHGWIIYIFFLQPFQLGWLPAPLLKCSTRRCL